jgi:hypothetical protein
METRSRVRTRSTAPLCSPALAPARREVALGRHSGHAAPSRCGTKGIVRQVKPAVRRASFCWSECGVAIGDGEPAAWGDPTDLKRRDYAAPLRLSLKLGAAPRASMFRASSPTRHASGWLPGSSARQDSGPIGASRWTAFRIHSPSRSLCSSARLPARAAGRRSGAAFGSGRIGICAVSSSPAPMEQLPGPHFCWRSDPAYVAVLWKQARMVLSIAAVMRPDLDALSDRSDRRLAGGLRNLIAVGRRFSILTGFLSSRLGRERGRWRRALTLAAGPPCGLPVGSSRPHPWRS